MSKQKNNNFLSRRTFIKGAISGGTIMALGSRSGSHSASKLSPRSQNSSIELPPLPFSEEALEPYISSKTLSFHYGKHHAGYVNKTISAIKETEYAAQSLIEIIKKTTKIPGKSGIFNNAAQVWNHTFYWMSLKPKGGGTPSGKLAQKIKENFGDFSVFKDKLIEAAAGQFGSGWAWLILENTELKIITTTNADTPLVHSQTPLLTIDVWEHAYYLDYQNRRKDYIQAILDHLINWEFAEKNFLKAAM